jgi:hypothetical protein
MSFSHRISIRDNKAAKLTAKTRSFSVSQALILKDMVALKLTRLAA